MFKIFIYIFLFSINLMAENLVILYSSPYYQKEFKNYIHISNKDILRIDVNKKYNIYIIIPETLENNKKLLDNLIDLVNKNKNVFIIKSQENSIIRENCFPEELENPKEDIIKFEKEFQKIRKKSNTELNSFWEYYFNLMNKDNVDLYKALENKNSKNQNFLDLLSINFPNSIYKGVICNSFENSIRLIEDEYLYKNIKNKKQIIIVEQFQIKKNKETSKIENNLFTLEEIKKIEDKLKRYKESYFVVNKSNDNKKILPFRYIKQNNLYQILIMDSSYNSIIFYEKFLK